jgi:purine catabolism regulator
MSVRVADLFKMHALKLAHTRAGVRGLNRDVNYIDVLESPDMDVLIKPGVLYLTSGFALYENVALQETLISGLNATGASGLVFEQGRYLTPLPAVIVEEAERLQFPVIELPLGAVFADIIREGLEMIFFQQGADLRRSQEIQKRLTEVAVAGGSLQQITQALANLVRNTVLVADRTFSLLAFAFWENQHQNHKRKAYAGSNLDQYLYNLEKTGFIDRIRQEKKPGRVEVLFSKQGEQAWGVVPVVVNGEILGYIAVLEDYHRMREVDWGALSQASTVTAVAIYKQVAEEEVQRRQRNDVLRGLLEGKMPPVGVMEQDSYLQVLLAQPLVVLQIEFLNIEEYCHKSFSDYQGGNSEQKSKLLNMIEAQLAAKQPDLRIACHQEAVTVLLLSKDAHAREKILQRVMQIKQEIDRLFPELEVVVGISRSCDDYRCLPQAYREALETLSIGRKLNNNGDIQFFADLGIYQVLMKFKEMPELAEYYANILGKLENLDSSTRSDLLKTLEAYFGANGNIYKAAQNLYLHRNSMKYRLERIAEILDVDLDNPDIRFNVQFALKIRHLL